MPTPFRLDRPPEMLRGLLVRRIQDVFNDRAWGERPVVRSDNALYERGTVIWRVHGDVTTMMIGGVAALLLQMLHPAALAGVWDHSSFRDDMLGRLRRTASFIAVTTFGERSEAEAVIARVRRVHEHVEGLLEDGTPYAASDPELLAWVHVCETIGFLDAWIAFGRPSMPMVEQDRYFAQAGEVARALGADPVPTSRAEAEALLARFRPCLAASPRSRQVAQMILSPPAPSLAMAPIQAMLIQAAVDMLPGWARDMHGLTPLPFSRALVRGGAFTVAQTSRWAFRQHQRPAAPESTPEIPATDERSSLAARSGCAIVDRRPDRNRTDAVRSAISSAAISNAADRCGPMAYRN